MTPTTLAEALYLAMGDLRSMYPSPGFARRQATALLALPPDRRAALAAELLDVETLGRALGPHPQDPELRLARAVGILHRLRSPK